MHVLNPVFLNLLLLLTKLLRNLYASLSVLSMSSLYLTDIQYNVLKLLTTIQVMA